MQESSYGIIPFRYQNNQLKLLLVCHHAGHRGFPKGRPEEGETPEQTAVRELREETGLSDIEIVPSTFQDEYFFVRDGQNIHKKVFYFVARIVVDQKLSHQHGELTDIGRFTPQEAMQKFTFDESKILLSNIVTALRAL